MCILEFVQIVDFFSQSELEEKNQTNWIVTYVEDTQKNHIHTHTKMLISQLVLDDSLTS
jgi:hypothetical protein